jgi:hypothetical protein
MSIVEYDRRTAHKQRQERLARLGRPTYVATYSPPPAPPEIKSLEWDAGCENMWFADLVSQRARPPGKISVRDIQLTVADHFGVPVDGLLSHRRTVNLALPRHVAMYLASRLTLRSAADIGRRFNRRDHTTVLHAIKKIDALCDTDSALFGAITQIRRRFI